MDVTTPIPDDREQPRFFYCHLQKTAGTRLIRRIRPNFPERAVYPHRSDGDQIARVISVDHLLRVWAERGDEIQFVSGHFPLCSAELLGGRFTTLTMLRDPLARTISYLRHHRRRTPDDRGLTLEQVYDDDFRFNCLIHNHMTKMLSLLPREMTDGALTKVEFTPGRLELAKERLAAVDAVGIQDDFDGFCDRVSEQFGWQLSELLPRVKRPEAELAPAFRDRILEDNAMDIELFDYARLLVSERSSVAT